jgi:hypothetical protein
MAGLSVCPWQRPIQGCFGVVELIVDRSDFWLQESMATLF